jgi:integration host factor subunit alpha
MALTKETMIDDIYNEVGLSKTKSRSVTENLFEIIKGTLEKDEDVLISGFGKFLVRNKKERRGRNPQTAHDLQLRARKVVVFKPSGVIRKNINS